MELLWRTQRRKTLIEWPLAVDDRLEYLVRAATAAGENVSRSQLLAALVAAADTSPERIAQVIRDYRRMDATALDNTHSGHDLPEARHPGPRRADRQSSAGN